MTVQGSLGGLLRGRWQELVDGLVDHLETGDLTLYQLFELPGILNPYVVIFLVLFRSFLERGKAAPINLRNSRLLMAFSQFLTVSHSGLLVSFATLGLLLV